MKVDWSRPLDNMLLVSNYYLYSQNLGFKFQADPVSLKYLESVMKAMPPCILAEHKEDTEM